MRQILLSNFPEMNCIVGFRPQGFSWNIFLDILLIQVRILCFDSTFATLYVLLVLKTAQFCACAVFRFIICYSIYQNSCIVLFLFIQVIYYPHGMYGCYFSDFSVINHTHIYTSTFKGNYVFLFAFGQVECVDNDIVMVPYGTVTSHVANKSGDIHSCIAVDVQVSMNFPYVCEYFLVVQHIHN